MSNKEKREVVAFGSSVEIRADEDGGTSTLVSMAPPYETLSVPMHGFVEGVGSVTFREQFARGAFGDLEGKDIIATFQHNEMSILGRTPNTLRLTEKKEGLQYEVDLPNTATGAEVRELVDRGDVRGSSFEFALDQTGETKGDSWEENDDGTWTRTVLRANLFQVGPVTHPAYKTGSEVALRSLSEAIASDEATPRLDAAARRMRLAELGQNDAQA